MRQNGFTLIELIVVIVLMGIISGLTSLIIGNTFQAYSDLARREALQSSTRLAIERITREVRHALPNSIPQINGASSFYFMVTVDGGRYQDQAAPNYISGQPRNALPISPLSSNQFDVISGKDLTASVGQWVVVNSLDMNIYSAASDRKQKINQILTKDTDNNPATTEINVIQFVNAVSFPQHSPYGRRFHIVEERAILFYISGGNLYRTQSLFANPTTPIGGPNNNNLLLENISAGSFTYIPGVQQRTGLLRINLAVTDEGETINIIHEVHVRNVP